MNDSITRNTKHTKNFKVLHFIVWVYYHTIAIVKRVTMPSCAMPVSNLVSVNGWN